MNLVGALAISLTLMTPQSIPDGPEVRPNARAPRLTVEAKTIIPGFGSFGLGPPSSPAQPTGSSAASNADKTRFLDFQCPVNADVGNYGCRVDPPADEDEPAEEGEERELTEGDVLTAVREIGMPSLPIRIEPGTTTLVNVKTNFYTDPAPFTRSIELLGFDVDIEATPVSFTWTHGDGTSATTQSSGRPYPHLDVTHRYRAPAAVVRPRVDVTYQVRYRVDGRAWAPLSQTLTATGPAGTLAVNEAAPVLTAP